MLRANTLLCSVLDELLGSFKIDISINSMDGVKAVPIIVDYLNKMPALRYLVLVIKSYLSRLRLNSASNGGLSSYSLICLVISFLQVRRLTTLHFMFHYDT